MSFLLPRLPIYDYLLYGIVLIILNKISVMELVACLSKTHVVELLVN